MNDANAVFWNGCNWGAQNAEISIVDRKIAQIQVIRSLVDNCKIAIQVRSTWN